jgi:hypothetical protein
MSSFECPICCELYDDKDFVPATLPCGHSTCRSHLVELPKKECPICRDVFSAELVINPNIALRDGAVAYSELLEANRELENKQLKDRNGNDSAILITEQHSANTKSLPDFNVSRTRILGAALTPLHILSTRILVRQFNGRK